MKIRLGPYQISGHRPGKPLKEGESGFVRFPVKIENTTARAHRANRVDLKQKGPVSAAPLDEREIEPQPRIVQKTVISVRPVPSKREDSQNFSVQHVKGEKFSVSPFFPRAKDLKTAGFNGDSLDVSALEAQEKGLFDAMGLDKAGNEKQFRDELATFVLEARDLFRDPQSVVEALKPLNDELGRELHWDERDYNGVDSLVLGDGDVMLPNYANINSLEQKKRQKLSSLLQKHEAVHGINAEGPVPLFDGFIESSVADGFMAEGHLFGENENRDSFMIHGTYSHRLQWECIRQWVKSGRLRVPAALRDPTIGDPAEDLGIQKKLLKAIVYVKDKGSNPISLWGKVFDSADDVRRNMDGPQVSQFRVEPMEKGMSFLAPNLMMTNIKCFGDALGLKHLQKYLNDSAVKRLKKLAIIDRSAAKLKMKSNAKINDYVVFQRLAYLLNGLSQPSFSSLPFTMPAFDDDHEANMTKMYAAFERDKQKDAQDFVAEQARKFEPRGPRAAPSAAPDASAPANAPDPGS